jgi:hypothetical protein
MLPGGYKLISVEGKMTEQRYDPVRTVTVGAAAGLATCLVYPTLTVAHPPLAIAVVLAAGMGPLLAVASWGLRQFLILHRPRLAADLGAMFNALAGALLTAMFLVQIAVGARTGDHPTREAEAIWLGLDVAWDVYVGLGTFCFAVGALSHPRLGRVVGWLGILIALGLLALNLATFPTPPANAGLVDVGPLIGGWYLLVTILLIRSRRWVREAAGNRHEPA